MTSEIRGAGKGRSFLGGRSNKGEFWLSVAVTWILVLALGEIFSNTATGGGMALLFIAIRRFHDLGLTGWWALAVIIGPVLVMLPVLGLNPYAALIVGFVAQMAALAWLGTRNGDPEPNRFGPPSRFNWRRPFAWSA